MTERSTPHVIARVFAVVAFLFALSGSVFALNAQATAEQQSEQQLNEGRKCDCSNANCAPLGYCCSGSGTSQECGCSMFVPNCDLNDT
jgi:hypothetical protein